MMRKIILLSLLFIGKSICAQNYFNLSPGFAAGNFEEWNQSIKTYNYARPWLKDPLNQMHAGLYAGAGLTGILAKALFISPEISYTNLRSFASNETVESSIRIHWCRANVQFDIFPREFGLDTVWFIFRPFLRVGAGASSLIPRIRFNNYLASVRDFKYAPVVWTYHYTLGVGCRYSLSRKFDIMPLIQYYYYPNINLIDFAEALHGSNVPNLRNNGKYFPMHFSVSLCFRIGKPDITEK